MARNVAQARRQQAVATYNLAIPPFASRLTSERAVVLAHARGIVLIQKQFTGKSPVESKRRKQGGSLFPDRMGGNDAILSQRAKE